MKLKTGKLTATCLFKFFLKWLKKDFLNYIVYVSKRLYSIGNFPIKWQDAFIVYLHTNGDLNKVINYRGIEAQAGFRQNMNTVYKELSYTAFFHARQVEIKKNV